MHVNYQTTSSSHASSPESRPIDLGNPVLEEEDETGSETAIEPITPVEAYNTQSQTIHDKMNIMLNRGHSAAFNPVPTSYNPDNTTSLVPFPVLDEDISALEGSATNAPDSRIPPLGRPAVPSMRGKAPSMKRVRSFFTGKRSKSQSENAIIQPLTQVDGSIISQYASGSVLMLSENVAETRPSTPSSGGSSASITQPRSPADSRQISQSTLQEPTDRDFFASGHKKNRSSTGNSIGSTLRDKVFSKHKISFAPPTKGQSHDRRNRATSVDLNEPSRDSSQRSRSQVRLPERQVWGMAPDAGTGLKARRLSLSLPDDFLVDVVELYSEYSDQNKVLGRKGKSIGRGATANVRLMTKKGGPSNEFYAVKEFRGKSTTEKAEDYEQKVKSEFSIAKSAHHPNIVETFRLCTHNGRWNQVMEFCDQGDLFGLVSQKYLSQNIHRVDRICLFKQLVQGLNYLHGHGIAHRDVKLENLLITKNSKLKITDFGVSEVFAGVHPGLRAAGGQCGKDMGEVRMCAPGMCGSPPYVAPEVIAKGGEYDPRPLDVWGAAIVMLCMTANGVLWPEAKPGSSPPYDDLLGGWTKWNARHSDISSPSITEADYPHVSFFDQFINPPALRRLLLTMLNPDPARRVSMAAVASNRWMKNVECCQIDSYDDPTVIIDASKSSTCLKNITKIVQHNHLPPPKHHGHHSFRLSSTDM